MRLFLAIFPPYTVTSQFRDTISNLKKFKTNFKFVAVDQIHLTVKFLGRTVSKESEDRIIQGIASIAGTQKSFTLNIEDLRFGFPKDRFPRILMYSVSQTRGIKEFTNKANERLRKLDLEDVVSRRERRKEFYHFTLGRLKRRMSNKDTRRLIDQIDSIKIPQDLSFKVESVYLMESSLTKSGPLYSKKYEFSLK